ASSVLMGSADWAAERGLTPLARVVDARSAAVDFVHGEEGLLMAPVHAVPELLDANGLTLQDLDLYEIHEAFAATVLTTLKAWDAAARPAASTPPSSTSPAPPSRPGTPSPPPAAAWSRPSPSCCTSGRRRPAASSAG